MKPNLAPLFFPLLLAALAASASLGCSSSSSNDLGGPGDDGGSGGDGTTGTQDSGGTRDSGLPGTDAMTSTDSSTSLEAATNDDSGASDGSATDASNGVDSSDGADSGGAIVDSGAPVDASCGSNPTLHADTPGDIFCGYDFDAGANLSCTTGQQCCLGGYIDGGTYAAQACSTWNAGATGCNNPGPDAIGVACAQNSDCTANGFSATNVACCLRGAMGPADDDCNYPKATLGTAVVCETTQGSGCATGEIQICSSDSDCPTGKTCVAGKWKILQVGFCQ
jgi:hypothetical protein